MSGGAFFGAKRPHASESGRKRILEYFLLLPLSLRKNPKQKGKNRTETKYKKGTEIGTQQAVASRQRDRSVMTSAATPSTSRGLVPLYTRKYLPDFDGPVARRARLTWPLCYREMYDECLSIYYRCKIDPPFRQDLSEEQKTYNTYVRELSDWDGVMNAFTSEVEKFRYLTFDLESFLPDRHRLSSIPVEDRRPEDSDRVVYAHFATFTGRSVCFDLEMISGGPVLEENPLLVLPEEFIDWLKDPEIIVAGSAVDKDADVAGIELLNMRDMNKVFEHYLSPQGQQEPLVSLGAKDKIGLGGQAFFSKGINFKPMGRGEFERYYGPHKYREGNRIKWPLWRNKFRLYKWQRDAEGNLNSHGRFYQYHDSTEPPSCAAALFMLKALRGDYIKAPEKYPWQMIDDLLTFPSPDDVLVLNAADEEEELWETSSGTLLLSSSSSGSGEPEGTGAQASTYLKKEKRKRIKANNVIHSRPSLSSAPSRRKRARSRTRTQLPRRQRSSAPESQGRGQSSLTSTPRATERTLTWPTPSSQRLAPTAGGPATPSRTPGARSCVSTTSLTTLICPSASTPGVRIRQPTGPPPASSSTTGAPAATTGDTARRRAA